MTHQFLERPTVRKQLGGDVQLQGHVLHRFFQRLQDLRVSSRIQRWLTRLGKLVEVTRYATVRKKLLKADDVEKWAKVLEAAKTK